MASLCHLWDPGLRRKEDWSREVDPWVRRAMGRGMARFCSVKAKKISKECGRYGLKCRECIWLLGVWKGLAQRAASGLRRE